jgi:cytoskeletal protein CcmA (bactofilin family)
MFKNRDDLDKQLQKAENETISSVIDQNMSVSGELSFKGKTRVDGIVNGSVSGDHLVLSQTGKIIGDVKVSSFVCHGTTDGTIVAEIVSARKECFIKGKLEAGSLTVDSGASLECEVKTTAGKPSITQGLDLPQKEEKPATDAKLTN